MSTGAQNPNYSALTLRIMWTIGLLCKCHVICQLFTFFHFAFDIELMETVMLNNHDYNIFCPHIPGRKLDNFSIVFKTLQLSFCSFSTYLSFEQLDEIIVRVAKGPISLMSTVLSTFPVKQNKQCEMKMEFSPKTTAVRPICAYFLQEEYICRGLLNIQ